MSKLRIGISSCLLGEKVRYDGGHKRNEFLLSHLDKKVEWISLCPEEGAGFGTPRPKMRLEGRAGQPRLIEIESRNSRNAAMKIYCLNEIAKLRRANLHGFILKSKSPSCGLGSTKRFLNNEIDSPSETGLFARALQEAFPDMPLLQETELQEAEACEQFLLRARAYCDELDAETSRKKNV